MKITLDNPSVFKEKINLIINSTFIKRLFSWKSIIIKLSEIKSLVYEAIQSNQELTITNKNLQDDLIIRKNDAIHFNESFNTLKQENDRIKDRLETLVPYKKENEDLQKRINLYKQTEHLNRKEYENAAAQLNSTQQIIENKERDRLQKEEKIKAVKLEEQKKTWKTHQDVTQSKIKTLCDVHGITYVNDFPFEGKSPDNTIQIINDYVIFDAKSPANTNLDNFPTYIKGQVKGIGKYGKYKEVHKTLYLVIPSNTSEVIKQRTYRDSNYVVNIITLDSLETILLTLKQREVYEYIDKLSPEESDCIESFISFFINSGKRRAQIDSFLNERFFNFLKEKVPHLPEKIRNNALAKEAGEKLNPPNQQINKVIDVDEEKLKHDKHKKILFITHEVKEIKKLNIEEDEENN